MRKLSTIFMLVALCYVKTYSQSELLEFSFKDSNTTPVNNGPHKTPPRFDMPNVSYDSDAKTIQFEYSDQIDGATYYIKDSEGNICMCGNISFDGDTNMEIALETLVSGVYVLEIIKADFDVVSSFCVNN